MEGVAYEMRRKIESLAASGIAARRLVLVGGPSESPIWPRIVAEVAGLELSLLNGQVAGALGAAILASLGAGLHPDEAAGFAAMGGESTSVAPEAESVRRYEVLYRSYLEKTSRKGA
jgi:sugar (pentulose or hexulose) kinase